MVTGILWMALAWAPSPAPAGTTDVAAAKRLYTIGEQHMAEGRAADAVALWRKVIPALPPSAEYDGQRHKLVLRFVYGLLAAHEQTGRPAYLLEAKATIDRHLAWHEARFGEGEAAKTERGDLYAQLGEVEARLEATADASARVEAPPIDEEPIEDHVDTTDGEVREVVVHTKKRERPSVDDPEIVARLKSPASDANAGLVLTAPGVQPLSPARGFVRLAGHARPSRALAGGRARKLARTRARAALVSARPNLRRCYESAFARTPAEVVQTELELTIDRDGRVRAVEVVGPEVIDADGSACVRESLAKARIEVSDAGRAVRVRMPVVFFWEDAKVLDEANLCTGSAWHVANCEKPRERNHGSEGDMPPIDAPMRGR